MVMMGNIIAGQRSTLTRRFTLTSRHVEPIEPDLMIYENTPERLM